MYICIINSSISSSTLVLVKYLPYTYIKLSFQKGLNTNTHTFSARLIFCGQNGFAQTLRAFAREHTISQWPNQINCNQLSWFGRIKANHSRSAQGEHGTRWTIAIINPHVRWGGGAGLGGRGRLEGWVLISTLCRSTNHHFAVESIANMYK